MRLPFGKALVLFAICSFALVSQGDAFKILVYNLKSGHSHASFMGRIADILVEAGHNVTSLISDLNPGVGDGTTKSHILRVDRFEKAQAALSGGTSIFEGSSRDILINLVFMNMARDKYAKQCTHLLEQPGLIDKLTAEKYDVVIAEMFDFCGFGIHHVIGAKSLVSVSSTHLHDWTAWHTGLPLTLSYVPSSQGFEMPSFSLWERGYNVLASLSAFYFYRERSGSSREVFVAKYGPEFPEISEIVAQSAFILTAGEPLVDFAKPMLRKIVDIGGLGTREPKPLPEEYKKLLALRPSTVLVSFGSVSKCTMMPEAYKRALGRAFARFSDVTFIWKYEEPEDNDHIKIAPNVHLRKWLPQNDLLDDKRVVGLISHGGKTSINEAAEKGIPTIFVPLFGDQPRNAAAAVHIGFGLAMDKKDLGDEEIIAGKLKELLENKNLRAAGRNVREMLAHKPFSSRELLVKHVEFAARFGSVKALEPQGRHLPLYVYFNLDLILIAALIVLLPLIIVALLLRKLIVKLMGNNRSSIAIERKKKL